MALQDEIEKLLILNGGEIAGKEITSKLESKYSKELIETFILDHSDLYTVNDSKVFSQELQIKSITLRLKDLFRKLHRKEPEFYKRVLELFVKNFDREKLDDDTYWALVSVREDEDFFWGLYEIFTSIDFRYFQNKKAKYELSSAVFELVLSEELRGFSLFTTPPTLIHLFSRLLPDLDGKRIYNPTAGILKLLTGIKVYKQNNFSLKASEIDQRVFRYGQLFSELNHLDVQYNCTDSREEITLEPSDYYDVVVANLPFGVKTRHRDVILQKYGELALHLISESYFKLKDGGKALFLVNESVLYSRTKEAVEFRREVVEGGYLKSIVLLPPNILLHTAVKTCLLVFEKTQGRDAIQYVDANSKEFYNVNSDKSISLKIDKIVAELGDENYDKGLEDEIAKVEEPKGNYRKKGSYKLSYPDILNNNFDLSIGRYQINESYSGDEYSNLSEILKPANTGKILVRGTLPYVRITELNSGQLELSNKIEVNKTRTTGKLLHHPAFLIGTIAGSYKPTFFDGLSPIEVSNTVAIYSFNENIVYPPYLIQELNADYVSDQMDLLAKGSVIKNITRRDLNSIKVKFPAYEEQKRIYDARIDVTIDQAYAQNKEKTISDFDVFKTFKHEIGNILKSPEGFLDLLPQFLENHNIKPEEQMVDSEPDTIGDLIASASKRIKQVYDVMENMQGILSSDKKYYHPERTELSAYIKKNLSEESTKEGVHFSVLVNESFSSKKKVDADIDTEQFDYILRNMVFNAIKHGKRDDVLNFIVNIASEEEQILIEFINDGKPLAANFSLDDYITYGRKSGDSKGQGLGGYLVNRVTENHQGTLNLIPSGKKFETKDGTVEASVHFSISLPKSK